MDGVVAYIGVGSNMGDALKSCKGAMAMLCKTKDVQLIDSASFYRTEPVGIEKQNWFVNTVIEVKTTLSARSLLNRVQDIENYMGRKRDIKNGPRVIDLDILLYGQDVINEADLTVPHPEMHKRRFVLEPLCEIASYFIHPAFGISVRGLKNRLDDGKIVELLEPRKR